MRDGPFYPDHGLERIVAYHERQDARFAEAADELQPAHRQADPHRHRAGRRRSRPTPARRPCGRRAGCATRAATGPSPRSATCTATPRYRRAATASTDAQRRRRPPGRRPRRPGARSRPLLLARAVALGRRRGRRGADAAADDRRRPPPPARAADHAAAVVPARAGRRSPATSTSTRSEPAVAAFGATLDDTSCVAVAVDGVAGRRDRR